MKKILGTCQLLLILLGVLAFFVSAAGAGGAKPPASGDRIVGDWKLTLDRNGRQMNSILTFSEDESGKLIGKWIGFRGASNLADLEYANHQLSFKRIDRFGDRESISSFTGTAERETLSGTLSSERGELKVEGKWIRPMSRAAGTWNIIVKDGQREHTANLIVSPDKDGILAAEWKGQEGQHTITNVTFKNPALTFKRSSKAPNRQWESTFQGTIKGDSLTGTFSSDQGDSSLKGRRVGAGLIGKWDLRITSDSGNRSQILTIHPNLSALYGAIPVEKINLEGNQVSFKTSIPFGDQDREISFAGRLDNKKLTGELTTSSGAQKVEGTRIPSPPRKKPSAQSQEKPIRQPDVVFVPTPQHVVDKMLELAEVKKDDVIYDLGCGDGRIVVTAAKKFGCKGVGYDISPQRVMESRANVEENNVGHLVTIEQEDIFTLDLSKANVITLYLLPGLNVKLIPQLEKLKPGSRIVSHDFDMRGVTPDKVIQIEDDEDTYGDHTIYLWTTPLKKEKNDMY